MLGLEVCTGALDNFGFEDYLNGNRPLILAMLNIPQGIIIFVNVVHFLAKLLAIDTSFLRPFADPRDSETFKPVDLHHGMEVRLGISKGPVAPSFM